jgi:hypothetical protein
MHINYRSPYRRLILTNLSVILLSFMLWLALAVTRTTLQGSCVIRDSCTFVEIVGRDPYCLLDPVCIAPLCVPPASGEPTWQGTYLVADPLLLTGNPLRTLALPNFLAFSAVMSLAVAVITNLVRRREVRRKIIVAFTVFWALEIIRWLVTVWMVATVTPGNVFFRDPLTYVGVTILVLPMVVAVSVALRRASRVENITATR